MNFVRRTIHACLSPISSERVDRWEAAPYSSRMLNGEECAENIRIVFFILIEQHDDDNDNEDDEEND